MHAIQQRPLDTTYSFFKSTEFWIVTPFEGNLFLRRFLADTVQPVEALRSQNDQNGERFSLCIYSDQPTLKAPAGCRTCGTHAFWAWGTNQRKLRKDGEQIVSSEATKLAAGRVEHMPFGPGEPINSIHIHHIHI